MTKLSKKQWLLAICCIIIGYLASFIPGRITITKTDSVKYHFFWSIKADAAKLQSGDYIRFTKSIDVDWYDCEPCSMVKRVGCISGEDLQKRGDSFFCQEKFIAKQNGSVEGEAFTFNGSIPPKHLFVVGDNDGSYDSRYFGFIKIEDIDANLIPIF
jgi:conjugal transfer pilin signal peptidase TrbI